MTTVRELREWLAPHDEDLRLRLILRSGNDDEESQIVTVAREGDALEIVIDGVCEEED